MKILSGGGALKIFRHPKGGSEKIVVLRGGLQKFVYFKTNRRLGGGGGASKKLNCERGGRQKFQASSLNIFMSPPCPIK